MTRKTTIITITLVLLLIAVGFAYWYFFFNGKGGSVTVSGTRTSTGFTPFGSLPGSGSALNTGSPGNGGSDGSGSLVTTSGNTGSIPTLRLLSNTPVGGYGASTTASTTVVRWVDRGRGNIYEASENTLNISTLSNTIVPRFYESIWNNTVTAFIGSMLSDGTDAPTTLYAALRPRTATSTLQNTSANTTLTPYELKGNNMPSTIATYAVSPKGDKVFIFSIENGAGVGYIANFNGTSMIKIFDTPLTQVNVEWPETNTVTITTKGTASQAGFMYFVNPKTGTWTKMLGPLYGLSTRTSHNAKYIVYSSTSNDQTVETAIYDVAKKTSTDAVIRTIADKCAWGNFYSEIVYCGVPSQPVSATYPDDWYAGTISLIDKIWQVNASTEEVHLISSIVDKSDRVIDAFNLRTDLKDNYLFFMNKNDLSLWSLNLVASN